MKKLIAAILVISLFIPQTVFGAQVVVTKLPNGVSEICSEFIEGRIIYKDAEGKCGFLDENYNIVVPARYNYVDEYDGGLAIVKEDLFKNAGVIDLDGNEVIPEIYRNIYPFNSSGFALVENSDFDYALVNRNGEFLTGWYDSADWYNQYAKYGAILMSNSDESRILVNEMQEIIELSQYDMVDDHIRDDRIAAVKDGKLGFLDIYGNEVIPFIYNFDRETNKYFFMEYFLSGLARVSFDGEHYGYINTDGDIVVPTIYDSIDKFSQNELAFAQKDGVNYLVNKSGETVYSYVERVNPCIWIDGEKWHIDVKSGGLYKYELASDFYDGAALAFDESKKYYGIVDENYNIIHDFDIPVIRVSLYRGMGDCVNRLIPSELSEGLISVCVNSKWGYMNMRGEMIIEPVFDKFYRPYGCEPSTGADKIVVGAKKFNHGYAKVSLDGVRYTIDKNGELYENIDIVEPYSFNGSKILRFPYLFLYDKYAALRDENENVIFEVKDGTMTDADGNVLIEDCAERVFDIEENRSHPAVTFAGFAGSGRLLNVDTSDGKYAVEIRN